MRKRRRTYYATIRKHGKDILDSEKFKKQDHFIQHGNITVKQHCISVANASIKLAKLLRIPYKERELVRGALLHDYFLYDWHLPHKDNNRLHGFTHPKVALRNATRDFHLADHEKEIIKHHMWPLTPVPPKNREAWIVNFADTYCSLLETLHIHKNRK